MSPLYKFFASFLIFSTPLLATTDRGACGLFLCIDALGWQAHQEGVNYALPFDGTSGTGAVVTPTFDFCGGFRVGGGYIFPCSDWAVESYWTHFAQKTTSNFDQLALNLQGNSFFAGTAASSQLSLNFNLIDCMLIRTFYPTSCFALTPSFGLQGAYIREKQSSHYAGGEYGSEESEVVTNTNFYGVGIEGALGIGWDICRFLGVLSLIGETKISLLTGRSYNTLLESNPNEPHFLNAHGNYLLVRQILDFKIGGQWRGCLCDRFPLTVDLVWESVLLPSNLKVISRLTNFSQGDLYFSGVTLSTRFGF